MSKYWWTFIIIVFFIAAGVTLFNRLQNQNLSFSPFSSRPQRIVSLSPNLTEILFELGLGEKIIAVSDDSDYPPQTAKKNKVGSFWQPNTEAIIASRPDLVITESFEQQRAVAESLKRLGYNVLSLKVEKLEGLFTAIEKIGAATGCKQRADKLVEGIRNHLHRLQVQFAAGTKAKVLWVVQTEPLRVAGKNTFVTELVELVGGQNAVGDTVQQYPPIGTEELLACAPEIIIHSAMRKNDIENEQKAAELFWSKWENIPAVRNQRIYVVDPDTILRLGPRVTQGAEIVARCIHPEISAQKFNLAQQVGGVNE
jgi:iron complex transport system substrate-binding protein